MKCKDPPIAAGTPWVVFRMTKLCDIIVEKNVTIV